MYWKENLGVSKKWDKYGFVNEVEIRITAWITLVLALTTFFLVMLRWEFYIALFVVWIIWIDFVLKIFIWPELSLFGIIVRPFIKNKKQILVWAVQKRFAWVIGFILSIFVIYCLLLLSWILESLNPQVLAIIEQIKVNIINNSFIVLPMNPAILACVLCIIFMFFESVFGICVWCKIYKFLVSKWVMKNYEWQNCINWSCKMK